MTVPWLDELGNLLGQFMAANPYIQPVALFGFIALLAIALIYGRHS